jgi:predicted metal-dependent enzyme (double-stranded beta helix superfamily)
MTIAEDRDRAVRQAVAAVRRIASGQGVTRASLEAVRSELIRLAAQRELFSEKDFPIGDAPGGERLYTLSVDPDDRFALYLDCCDAHTETPPHNHTTWAVIVGVHGEELNRFYRPRHVEAAEERAAPDQRGPLELVGEETVRPGGGVCLLPDDFHSIHVEGGRVNMNLHMYGKALSDLPDRVKYDWESETYAWFAPHPDAALPG